MLSFLHIRHRLRAKDGSARADCDKKEKVPLLPADCCVGQVLGYMDCTIR